MRESIKINDRYEMRFNELGAYYYDLIDGYELFPNEVLKVRTRKCLKCDKLLNFREGFTQQWLKSIEKDDHDNIDFTVFYIKVWDSNYVEFYCCDCYKRVFE